MRIPNYQKKKIKIKELVQSIDILPTILEITGLSPHKKAQGQSLFPLIKRQKNFFNRTFWKLDHFFEKDSQISFAERTTYHYYSIINDGYQMIYNVKSDSIRLFDLKADPLTQKNIAKNHNDVSKRLLLKLNKVFDKKTIYRGPQLTLDQKTREQLKALGYIN